MDPHDTPPRDRFARGYYRADEDIPPRNPPNDDPDAWEVEECSDEQRLQNNRDYLWEYNRGWVELCTTDPRVSEDAKIELTNDPAVRQWVWTELARERKFGEAPNWLPRSVASGLAMRMQSDFDRWYAEQEADGAGAGGPGDGGGPDGSTPPPNGPTAAPDGQRRKQEKERRRICPDAATDPEFPVPESR